MRLNQVLIQVTDLDRSAGFYIRRLCLFWAGENRLRPPSRLADDASF